MTYAQRWFYSSMLVKEPVQYRDYMVLDGIEILYYCMCVCVYVYVCVCVCVCGGGFETLLLR